tara:strand:- start:2555 stop:4021 length:1467 start_codon:yes stop_codon:yes gene_type:complete
MDNKEEEHRLIKHRKEKLERIKESRNPYKNNYARTHQCKDVINDQSLIGNSNIKVSVLGRMSSKRMMGKSNFAHIKDMSGKLQFFVDKTKLDQNHFSEFKISDIGDVISISGNIFLTKTKEITLNCESFEIVTKSLRPIPENFYGLADQEIKYRKRYLDLICNEETRDIFIKRSKIIKLIRDYFEKNNYIEVETPMMHKIPGGAKARPFTTHHNTLDMDLYMRIAPELFLKKLIVGGFEKIFELNRNFRNEGVSSKHNPEFSMIEFYQSYATFDDLMKFTQELLKFIAMELSNSHIINYQGNEIDFSKSFDVLDMKDSILKYNEDITENDLNNKDSLKKIFSNIKIPYNDGSSLGELHFELFEKTVEAKLINPTFITNHPVEVSPLARLNDNNKEMTDRFELFIAGKEIANGFSELNDPEDQKRRFEKQIALKDKGDLEAMHYDEEFIEALEYGMPPTAGEGIGIDRLIMLFTNSSSIRDVLLFPLMR